MNEDLKNLQNELLRLTQRLMALEADKISEKPIDYSLVIQSIRNQAEQLEKRADNHGARINILEEARRNQIRLNIQLLEKKSEPKTFNWFRK